MQRLCPHVSELMDFATPPDDYRYTEGRPTIAPMWIDDDRMDRWRREMDFWCDDVFESKL
eukprot:SAG22_NODE_14697_length_367_cov_1.145522_1_plen_59_part_10